VGSKLNITWSYTGSPGSTVNIGLSKGGQAVSTIATSVTTTNGSYAWTIPTTLSAASNYQITVGNSVCSGASGQFSIAVPTPTISVTAPTSGTAVTTGSKLNVSWTYTGSPGAVNITLLKGGQPTSTIATNVAVANDSYTWTVPSTLAAGTNYQVQIASTTCSGTSGQFSITTPAPTPASAIKFTSPAGGVTWKRGTIQTITWNYTGSVAALEINLMQSGKTVQLIGYYACGQSGSYSFPWLIFPTLSAGSNYQIEISSLPGSAQSVSGTSPVFSLN
jgi:hypothetical protein